METEKQSKTTWPCTHTHTQPLLELWGAREASEQGSFMATCREAASPTAPPALNVQLFQISPDYLTI